jgi:hypothetical protein
MIIANPIYDATFKCLLENNRVAKFLIGTILNCRVISLEPATTEHVDKDKDSGRITLYRKDFAATIETEEEGQKRVIIEMQKAKNLGDISRFRKYLGGEYTKSQLPIIAIYILGFNLSVDAAAFVAYPEHRDLRTNENLKIDDSFVDGLTHKAYFVQTPKIKPSLGSKLDMILSIFEQANFITEDKTIKKFPFETDDPDIKELLKILNYVASDEKIREELDKELYFQDYVEEVFGKSFRELLKKDEELKKQKEEIDKKNEEIDKKNEEMKVLKNKNLSIVEKMKQRGIPIEEIAEMTGISLEEVKKL